MACNMLMPLTEDTSLRCIHLFILFWENFLVIYIG